MSLDINVSCLNIKSGKEVCSKSSTFVTRFSAIPLPMLPRPMNPTVLLVLANGDFKNVFFYCTLNLNTVLQPWLPWRACISLRCRPFCPKPLITLADFGKVKSAWISWKIQISCKYDEQTVFRSLPCTCCIQVLSSAGYENMFRPESLTIALYF